MKRRDSLISYGIMLLMFSALFFAAATRAQSQTAQPPPTESPTAQPSMMPPQGRDDVTMQQLVDFGDFLNRHPEIADQLRRDPSLVDNQDFVNKHPELQEFLQQHPEIRAELSRNPDGFMRQEDRLDRREEDPNRAQLADMDQFLNRHPEIAEQLRKDPSLVNNREFVENHPALQQFLADHPEIRTEFKDHPDAFMRDAERFDHHDDRGLDPNRAQLADMDQFLNRHPEIAEQLRKDPSLVNNREFVENHPAFQAFLTDHPEIRTEFKDHPDAFMRDAERFDHHDDSTIARNRNGGGSELSSFNQFLAGHGNIAGELSKNPSLANNHEYLETHPELQAYLAANPQVHEQLNQNPQVFVQSAQQMSTHSTTTVTGDSKPK